MYNKLAQTYHISMSTSMNAQSATRAMLNFPTDYPKAAQLGG